MARGRTDPRHATALAMLGEGKTCRAIAQALGLAVCTVFNWRRRAGQSTGRKPWMTSDLSRLRELAAEGLSDRVIAERLGRTAAAIKTKRRVEGLAEPRVRREAEAVAVPRPMPVMRLPAGPDDAVRRRIESQVMLGVPRRNAEIEAMRWYERRRS